MRVVLPLICVVVCLGSIGGAQEASSGPEPLARLSHELQETRAQLAESQRQIQELQQGLEDLRRQLDANRTFQKQNALVPEPSVEAANQDIGFLAAKIDELHQDKVESASKYPVKFSGLILFNSYVNSGTLDADDLPSLAFPRSPGSPNGSIGATLSQTLLGIDARGPQLFSARSSADVTFDFGGGSPTTSYGVTAGIVRLRTATVHLNWEKTSLNIGQDTPFFSPWSPTSYATIREPAFSWAGNLWVWTPQIEVERKFALSSGSTVVLQGGLLDPLTEEAPSPQGRAATPGEVTRVPAIAGRIALDHSSGIRPFTVGFAGYRARQKYPKFSGVDSWTVNTDFRWAPEKHLEISGEWYKGQAVGGLGGGIWTSVVYPQSAAPYNAIHGLRSTGGWSQIKLKPVVQFEINGAIGQDENYGKDLASYPFAVYGYLAFQKNRAGFVNLIYKPAASLLFALEYRRLQTTLSRSQAASGDQVNLAAGVHF
jgi:hypothetical protein